MNSSIWTEEKEQARQDRMAKVQAQIEAANERAQANLVVGSQLGHLGYLKENGINGEQQGAVIAGLQEAGVNPVWYQDIDEPDSYDAYFRRSAICSQSWLDGFLSTEPVEGDDSFLSEQAGDWLEKARRRANTALDRFGHEINYQYPPSTQEDVISIFTREQAAIKQELGGKENELKRLQQKREIVSGILTDVMNS